MKRNAMGKKILIIDDNEQDRKIMTRYLRLEGYKEILLAQNGQEGIVMAESEKPDLVILDTLLPDLHGFEVCRRIKQQENGGVKIVVITGYIDAVDVRKARESGADDYVVKTSDHLPLLKVVKQLL